MSAQATPPAAARTPAAAVRTPWAPDRSALRGRVAVAALAADPGRARWNQRSVTSGQLAAEYGFTDVDGSQPDIWPRLERPAEAPAPAAGQEPHAPR
ncbi:hypothetical protein MXD62_19140 [Frankia sp. Mgl5]|nr:hypothetical protein [Frankia sp. Mgl5]MCK9929267.1 hypothetical protein [Frankia sp. Mgl5]